jgi:methionyl-tRNA formyltransferase
MKILICAKRDLLGSIALNLLLPRIKNHSVSVILSDVYSRRERETNESRIGRFYEHELLEKIVFPLLDKIDDSTNHVARYLSYQQIENQFGIPVVTLGNINRAESIDYVANFSPDIVLSCRYDYIFKEPILSMPKYGIVNTHSGKLPAYRGVNAPLHSILNEETSVACTLHYVDHGIDTGDIIEISHTPIDPRHSLLWHGANIYKLGIEAFLRWLNRIEKKQRIITISQESMSGSYYGFPSHQEFTALQQKGIELIGYTDYLEMLSGYLGGEASFLKA